MKNNDLSFLFLALIVLSGLIAACLPSANATATTSPAPAPLVQTVRAPVPHTAPATHSVGRAQS